MAGGHGEVVRLHLPVRRGHVRFAPPPTSGQHLGRIVVDHAGIRVDRTTATVVRTGVDLDRRTGGEPGHHLDVEHRLAHRARDRSAIDLGIRHRHIGAETGLVRSDVGGRMGLELEDPDGLARALSSSGIERRQSVRGGHLRGRSCRR